MLAAPASLACQENALLRTQATTGQPKQSGVPCASGVNGCSVLSLVYRAF